MYQPLEQGFLEILTSVQAGRLRRLRPDARRSRLGHVLDRGVSFVNGDEDAQEAAANIEASWPS